MGTRSLGIGPVGAFMPGEDVMEPVPLVSREMLQAFGPSLLSRMREADAAQQQRWQAGERSPTPMTEDRAWLADDVAGSLLGPMGIMGAIKAYHGSPHRFDRFDMSKIGTGEGAQAYGSGLYFAESEGVARSYRDALSGNQIARIEIDGRPEFAGNLADDLFETVKARPDPTDGQGLYTLGESSSAYTGWLNAFNDFADGRGFRGEGSPDWAPKADPYDAGYQAAVDVLRERGAIRRDPGALYTTRLDVEPEDLLNYDAPLPQAVRDIISAKLRDRDLGDEGVKAFWKNAGDTGDAYVKAERFLGPGSLIDAMKEAGYKGISYLDQQSRYIPSNLPDNPIANEARQFLDAASGDADAALKAFNDSNPVQRLASDERDEVRKVIKAAGRQATRNFVIFDDKLIDIEGIE